MSYTLIAFVFLFLWATGIMDRQEAKIKKLQKEKADLEREELTKESEIEIKTKAPVLENAFQVIQCLHHSKEFDDYALIQNVETDLTTYNEDWTIRNIEQFAILSKTGKHHNLDLKEAKQLNYLLPMQLVYDNDTSAVEFTNDKLVKLKAINEITNYMAIRLGVERTMDLTKVINDLENNPE